MADPRSDTPEPTAQAVLAASLAWYRKQAWHARRHYHADEIAILVVAALIPTTTALELGSWSSALLGATMVVLTGLRAIFRWHDDWVRFTEACTQLVTEREHYRFRVGPYGAADRDQQLIQHVRDIETAETQGWLHMRRATIQSPDFATAATERDRPASPTGEAAAA